MLPIDARPVSVDDHIIEPAHLWVERLPRKYGGVGPRVVEADGGHHAWAYEDQVLPIVRGNTRTLPGLDDDPRGFVRFDEMRPGCYEPNARLADMDADGVWAQVNFPNFARFAGHRFLEGRDRELAALCVAAYNDFVLDEWSASDPQRLIPLGIVPLWDATAAAAEVRRIAAMGAKAVAFSENPTSLGLPSVYTDNWEPLWDAVADTGVVICLHIGSSSKLIRSSPDAPECSVLPYVGANSMVACTDWLFSGILDRHRALRVAFSEGGAGWVPYLLEQAQHVFDEYRTQLAAARSPRETFAEHMYVCVLRDDTALAALDVIPEDNITWESDYPHGSTLFPDSRAALEHSVRALPDTTKLKIAETNARRLFGV